jgi:hypothetical protein
MSAHDQQTLPMQLSALRGYAGRLDIDRTEAWRFLGQG